MLKTALKPRWILLLILAMSIAAGFVLLSQWQFNSSRDAPPPAPSTTENVRPLTEVFQPYDPLPASIADQMVSFDGEFVPDTRILVQNRVLDDREGLWVVQGFEVEGSEAGEPAVIPVVLGWVPEAGRLASVQVQQGPATVVGRLLPPEAPEVQRPVEGQVPTLSTAELSNLWDRASYAAFVVATDVIAADVGAVGFASGMDQVVVGPQPQETPVNWLNIFYAIEWFVFAGFAFFLWWRLVADDHRRTLEDEADAAEASRTDDDARRAEGSVAVVPASPSANEHESGAHRD